VKQAYITEARIALDAWRRDEPVTLLGRTLARDTKKTKGGDLTELDVETKTSIIQVEIGYYGSKEKKLDPRHDAQLTKTIQEARREMKDSGGKIKRKVVVHLVNPESDVSQKLIETVEARGRARPGTPENVEVEVRLGPR
jgi:ribosomal silencing factor RsfS